MKASAEINAEGFAAELKLLRKEIESKIGTEDFIHLRKIERWGRICTIMGYVTAWIIPNPISALLMSQGNMVRWTIMMHHIGHKGYDKVNCPSRYKSKSFALGLRRSIDWFDWILPEAWNYEHNILHHYHTGETKDPDLVERNVEMIRQIRSPLFIKYFILVFFMCTWKFTYYAPNTFWLYLRKRNKILKNEETRFVPNANPGLRLLLPLSKDAIAFWIRCILPYSAFRFVIIPSLFLVISPNAFFFVLINSLLAEVFTNIYTFCIIVPNHAGEDLYRYNEETKNRSEFYVRQVMGSVNYNSGTNRIDFMHGWLNYQIEHHLFPDLPLLKYQQYQPRVKQLCEKYNIRYMQESVWKRIKKMTDIAVGKSSMMRWKDERS